jgi:hypothetical protein
LLFKKTTKKLDDKINNISNATEEQIEQAKKKTATIDAVVGHPKTAGVDLSSFSMGVPVKPIYEALGKASRKYLAFPYRISESSLVVTT